jgi:hypothetical protein
MGELHYNVRMFKQSLLDNGFESHTLKERGSTLVIETSHVNPELARLASFWDILLTPNIQQHSCSCCATRVDSFGAHYNNSE